MMFCFALRIKTLATNSYILWIHKETARAATQTRCSIDLSMRLCRLHCSSPGSYEHCFSPGTGD